MKRQIISSVLALGMVFGAAAYLPEGYAAQNRITAQAEDKEFTSGDYSYRVLDDGTAEITYWSKNWSDDVTEIKVPSKLDGIKVTRIGDWVFCDSSDNENTSVKSIVIPEGITHLGSTNFCGYINAESISIPKSVTSIDGGTFQNTKWLEELHKKSKYVVINGILISAKDCKGDVKIPNTAKSIAKWVFSYNSSITSVTIPKTVKSIGKEAFFNCTSLKKIIIENGVTSIGDAAFGRTAIETIDLPDSITDLGSATFFFCEKLKEITIPDKVKELKSTLGQNGNSIGKNGTFCGCSSLKKINLPKTLKKIDDGAFYGCTSLETITLPDSVTDIGGGLFHKCTSLKKVKFPKGIKALKMGLTHAGNDSGGHGFFEECSSLTDITLPNGLEEIGGFAFYGCTNIKTITIPKSVKSIMFNAIDGGGWDYEKNEPIKNNDLTVYCYPGSFTEKYAKANKIKYKYALVYSKATLSKTSYVYSGKAKKPAVTVKFGSKALKKGTDYTVTYKNNKKVGTATVTIKGKGDYKGTVSKTFKINPKKTTVKKVTSPKKKQLKVTYKKVAGVTGYQVTYSTSKKFTKKTTKTVTVKGKATTSKVIKGLKAGKTYYVKVRSYKTVGGKKYYSSYTAVKKVKISK